MAKKRKYKNKPLLDLKYGWEFLRRKEEYRKDFFNAIASLKKELSREDFKIAKDSDFNDERTYKVNKKTDAYFQKKYSLGYPLNPDIPFDCLGLGKLSDCPKNKKDSSWRFRASSFKSSAFISTNSSSDGIHLNAVILSAVKPFEKNFLYVLAKNNIQFFKPNFEPLKPKVMPDKITLEVDLKYPLEVIKPALETFVNGFKNIRKRLGSEEQRTRYDKYDNYLLIYDLYKQKRSRREIAKIVYKEEYKDLTEYSSNKYDILPLTEKVKNNLKACQELINGGYKIIG